MAVEKEKPQIVCNFVTSGMLAPNEIKNSYALLVKEMTDSCDGPLLSERNLQLTYLQELTKVGTAC